MASLLWTTCSTRGSGDSGAVGDLLADPKAHDPSGSFEKEETWYVLVDAVNRLPDRDRLVVTLYYFEGLTLAEIGRVLSVTRVAGVPDPHQGGP